MRLNQFCPIMAKEIYYLMLWCLHHEQWPTINDKMTFRGLSLQNFMLNMFQYQCCHIWFSCHMICIKQSFLSDPNGSICLATAWYMYALLCWQAPYNFTCCKSGQVIFVILSRSIKALIKCFMLVKFSAPSTKPFHRSHPPMDIESTGHVLTWQDSELSKLYWLT